jgi:hypothetical protein
MSANKALDDIAAWIRQQAKRMGLGAAWKPAVVHDLANRIARAMVAAAGDAATMHKALSEATSVEALRAALEKLMKFTCECCRERYCEEPEEFEDGQGYSLPCNAILEARHALEKPLRNCDVGTASEQAKRFKEFCDEHTDGGRNPGCGMCPVLSRHETKDACQFHWGQMPYEDKEETHG